MTLKLTTSDRKKKILLVEDDLSLLDNTREILELHGYEVLTASSSRKGIEILASVKPDLILCDICMPGPNGHLVLHYTRKSQESKDLPFLFFSAQAEKQDITEALNAGADGYIIKPFSMPALIETVNNHLNLAKKKIWSQKRQLQPSVFRPGNKTRLKSLI